MPPLAGHILLLLGGIVLLLVGGRFMVSASVDTARRLGVAPLLVGLTIVAWGTSAPELALNLVSALRGRSELALGNVIGANICNMGLVLGVCALIRSLKVEERLIRVEIGLNAALLTFLAAAGLSSAGYNRWEAAAALLGFVGYSVFTIIGGLRAGPASTHLVPTAEPEGFPLPVMSWWKIGTYFIAGLALLSGGGSLASDAAVGIATGLGIPQAIVAVTIVSIGTTLPEMVTGILAVRRGQVDLAMGNAIGSCLFNAGAIFGLTGLIAPPPAPSDAAVSLVTMVLLAVILIPLSRTFQRHLARIEGAFLLAIYAAFLSVQAVLAIRGA